MGDCSACTAAGPSSLLELPEPAVAWVAMQLVSHWGNRTLPPPAPRAEVVLAASCLAGSGGEPGGACTTSERRSAVARHWLAAVGAAERMSRYAAVLVAAVGEDVAGAADPELSSELAPAVQRLRQQLSHVARYGQAVDGAGWRRSCACLTACLRLAHATLAGLPRIEVSGDGPSGELTVAAERIAADVYRLRPWPFRGPRARAVAELTTDRGEIALRAVRLQRSQVASA